MKRRLGELHRLLNSRKGVANDKAHDFNEKSVQALDASAKEYDVEGHHGQCYTEEEAGNFTA